MLCILEQSDNKVKENMLTYFALLMQDVIELSVNTGHMLAVLQEMERGRLSWMEPDLFEKIKVRNTQRIFQSHKTASNSVVQTKCC